MSSSTLKYKRIFSPNGGSSSSTGINSIVGGTNITIDNTDPQNPIINSSADDITVVANYSALPAAGTVTGKFYWCSASQGTKWIGGLLFGGTYYNSGLYYSNGVTWEAIETPYQATQAEVNTGTNTDKFVTPATLKNSTQWSIAGLTVGTSTITSGTNTRILYNNSGVLGEYTLTGTGTVVAMQTSPSFLTSTSISAVTATTAATDVLQTLVNNSSGTPAAGYGIQQLFQLKSTTTNSQTAGAINVYWNDATHATRRSAISLQVVDASSTLADGFAVVQLAGNVRECRVIGNTSGYSTLQLYSGTTKRFTFECSTDAYLSTWTTGALMYFRPGIATQALSLSTTAMTFSDAVNLVFNTTTGSKIGTATTQKISFWNAAPIVQPTTGVAAATFVANTSGIANDTATFDGYTIGQIVKALRNTGLLA